jgi:inorganic triphosphatase YgiF
MTARQESEVKLELPVAAAPLLKRLPLLRAIARPPQRKAEVSVYFDTPKHKLRKQALMLRVRHSDGCYVQTIKATKNGDVFARDEWECEIAGPEPDLRRASGTALAPLLGKKLRRRLEPIFETRVRRTLYPLVREAYAVALTLDRGSIETGTSSLPLCELEVELERGSEADLFAIAREITHALPAHLSMSSKAERGYRLADGEDGAPIGFVPPSLKPGLSSRVGFQRIGRACLQQILGNERALLRGDAAGVHQMRVGIRRLRAVMSLCSELLRDSQSAAVKAELRWLAGKLAPVRELDVLMRQVVAPVAKQRSGCRGMAALTRRFAARREAALARARDAVTSKRFRALTLDAAAWLETGEWTQPQDALVRDRGALPMENLARKQLRRRQCKVRKRRKSFAALDARRRHKLRIQAKKLRYAVEFFADLFPGKRADKQQKRFLDAIECVQHCLGELNDIVVHERLIGAMGVNRRHTGGDGAFAAGLLSGREDVRVDAAMAAASKALARFAKVGPFWR